VRLKDKVAVITGAATGIGRASAVRFAREGARVVIGDVNDAEAEETLRLSRDGGGDVRYVRCDVRRTADVNALVQAAVDAHGRLDVIFNNAGKNFYGKVHETSDEDWDDCLSLNLGGIFRGMRAALPHMMRQGGGSIINTASIQAIVAFPDFAAYEAAKGGIVALTRQAALDYAPHKIRVNSICPGVIRTPMNPEMWNPSLDSGASLQRWNEQTPMLRVGEAEDIANTALYLASDESAWTTGQYFLVDGGLSIKGP
jgi:NAD(P)-dependent dehydrogenase (short-subunit alcohol dehydrogenase family)